MEITQEDMIKNYREVNAEQDYKIRMLEKENQRLKKQLNDYEKALKEYADPFYDKQPVNELAKITLKKWENK